METKKTTVRGHFEPLVDRLCATLNKYGFHVLETMKVQREELATSGLPARCHVVLTDLPVTSSAMLLVPGAEGMIAPCCITVLEVYPDQMEMILVNITEVLATQAGLVNLSTMAHQLTQRLEHVLQETVSHSHWTPDLITSWS